MFKNKFIKGRIVKRMSDGELLLYPSAGGPARELEQEFSDFEGELVTIEIKIGSLFDEERYDS